MNNLRTLLILLLFSWIGITYSQELHTHSNAASIANEANSTSGWGGSATATVSSTESYSGSYSIKVEPPNTGWNYIQYSFTSTPNQQYVVSVYAKSDSTDDPRIYYSGDIVSTGSIQITNTNWTEYSKTIEATGANAIVRIYPGTPATNLGVIHIDHISITPVGGGDTQAPTAPTVTSSGNTTTTVDLSWSGATDNVGVTAYDVYQDGTVVGNDITTTTYQATGLTASTSYDFKVRALDAAGNESPDSNVLSITTGSASDTQAPTAPTSVQSPSNTDTTANLTWNAATDNVGVTGYRVYKDGVLEDTPGNVTSHQVTGLIASTTYDFTITALDAAGNESVPSTAASVTTNAASGGGTSVWTESGATASYTGEVAVGVSTVPSGYKMAVDGKLITEEVRVELSGTWPDYVFEEDYNLPTLEEIQQHISEKGHLPNIPSAQEIESNGLELGEMNRLLLEKIEELTLYILDQQKRIEQLENQGIKVSSKKE